MVIHSNILAWRTPLTEEPAVHGVAKSQTRLSEEREKKANVAKW